MLFVSVIGFSDIGGLLVPRNIYLKPHQSEFCGVGDRSANARQSLHDSTSQAGRITKDKMNKV